MGCCGKPFTFEPEGSLVAAAPPVSRRGLIKGVAAAAGALATFSGGASAQSHPIKLAFCSQLLCVVPYEVARAGGHFAKEGLDVELVYTRGGNAAMQALVGSAVDYAATSLDVALQAYVRGAEIRRFATTGRLPLFAVATAPDSAQEIKQIEDLAGKTIGVSALGNADHALMLFLLKRANVNPTTVQFATLGPNLLEALRQGQVDAGLVQEPALTLVEKAGGRVLVNAMDSKDAEQFLGGPYEFMGVAVRAGEIEARRAEMEKLARALRSALQSLQSMSPEELVKALPPALTTGANLDEMREVLARYRASLYPTTVAIDLNASARVAESLKTAGLIPPDANTSGLFDTSIVGGG
ncbi:ABC transporter substrate-binding protein [Microvirga roseola]|uniref:ABC transporter substrate-binding protein n=1 Tax=Microvirga roseola TaxID=2883126 RepID=UPI001E5FC65D|nr:ABC transporter substrate-binding protein [Microvirga roseola]